MKILILGGYGVFGGRLAELLCDISQMEIVICGRNSARASEFCQSCEGNSSLKPLQLDRNDIEQALRKVRPDIVVDATGPFQDYSDNPYLVIEACIEMGVHYLDFADSADFVLGISQFDAKARQSGVFVLSGASSFPVLTAAVVKEMAKDMEIISVEGGVAPSPYAGIGLNVVRAIISYAGGPVKLTRNHQQFEAKGLTESMRFTVSPPGLLPLKNTRFSLIDVPDLQVIPAKHETLRDIWMGAGPRPELLLRLFNVLAGIRAVFNLPSMAPLAPLFHRVLNSMKFGEHRGGMFVRARGVKNGKQIERSWHLLAEGDDGPFIPSMAIEAIVRKMLWGEWPDAGARPATNVLSLKDYDDLFENRMICTGFRDEVNATAPLYKQVLGSTFETLPDKVQAIHAMSNARSWYGFAKVRRGNGILAKAIARVFGFPSATESTPATVSFSPEGGGERWTRNFGGAIFNSFQTRGTGRDECLLMERFGVIKVGLALVVENNRLILIPRNWTILGLPLPKFLLPSGNSFETEKNGIFHFDVEISAPFIGLIVGYSGTLEPKLH